MNNEFVYILNKNIILTRDIPLEHDKSTCLRSRIFAFGGNFLRKSVYSYFFLPALRS